jgi:hypothetical protein
MLAVLSLIVFAVAGTAPAAAQSDATVRWDYRILSKVELLELGKQDLAAGLNHLGAQGWELAAIDTVYIFKRPQRLVQVEALKQRCQLAESDAAQWKERVMWAERMVRKGLLSANQLEANKAQLSAAEIALDLARRDLDRYLLVAPKEEPGKDAKPKK